MSTVVIDPVADQLMVRDDPVVQVTLDAGLVTVTEADGADPGTIVKNPV
jgi:hypothetical protein